MYQRIVIRSFFIIVMCAFVAIPPLRVHAGGSLAVSNLSPSGSIGVGGAVTFSVTPTGFISPTFTVNDDFLGTSVLPNNITGWGYFSWTPVTRDIGTHNITISATDAYGNSASVTQSLTIIAPTASVASFVGGPSGYVGTPMTFQVSPVGFVNPTYWIGDSVGDSTLTNSKLNSSGAFYWVPTAKDIGTHRAIINVSDSLGHFVDLSQEITVSPAPLPEVKSLTPGATIPVGVAVTFSVTSPGFTNPTYAVFDSYIPSTITSANISSSGVFTWTPALQQTGKHMIRITIRDTSGQSADVTQEIIVESANLSIDALTPGEKVVVGTPVRFTVTPTGFVNPTYSLSDMKAGGTARSDNLSASGLFSWTPSTGDIGVHTLVVNAIDNLGNSATIRKDITVVPVEATPSPMATVVVNPNSPVGSLMAPAKTPAYFFAKFLTIGSSGADVLALQQLLQKLGYFTVTPNGNFGPMTAGAVKKFQSANGLEPLGFIGPGTRAKLNALGGVSAGTPGKYLFMKPLALGASGTEVTELQKKLATLGFYMRTPNGIFDLTTVEAVKKFQASKGLEQVGSVGPGTRSALNAL